MRTAVLSPHLDDAVLSCWHLLEGPGELVVLNVFTASPPPGAPAAWWDHLTGAADSGERMRERRAEDREALALAGRHAVALDLLDDQYRDWAPAPADVAERIAATLAADTRLCAPAALDGQPDHVVVRDAALRLAGAGQALSLYADLPHAIARGWPGWVTGTPTGDIDDSWSATLAASGLHVDELLARVRPLDARARARKLRAIEAYRTQRVALDRCAFVPLGDARALAWEVTWEVPPSALGGADETGSERLVADSLGEPTGDRR